MSSFPLTYRDESELERGDPIFIGSFEVVQEFFMLYCVDLVIV